MAGALWHEQRLPPFPQIKFLKAYLKGDFIEHIPPEGWRELLAVRYGVKTPVYSNRHYHHTPRDPPLDGTYVLQITRHHEDDIVIEAKEPLTVYRVISLDNKNNLDGWEKTPIKVNIVGRSTIHTEVYKKNFEIRTIVLEPGIFTASVLILIKPKKCTKRACSFLQLPEPGKW